MGIQAITNERIAMPVYRTTIAMTDAVWEGLNLAQGYLTQQNERKVSQHVVILTALSYLQSIIETIEKSRILKIYDDEALNGKAHKPTLHFNSLEWKERSDAIESVIRTKAPEIETTSIKLVVAMALIIYAQDIVLPTMPGAKVDALDKIGQRRTKE